MNVYFLGMCISMAVYLVIGFYISKKVRTIDDYYVAGRRAPTLLIAGSLIASFISTGAFMGDAGEFYRGLFAPMVIICTMETAGYLLGAVFFGRYLRRSHVLTIPDFFGKRFCSGKLKKLAAVTSLVTMTVYMLSIMQGIGTLMHAVTGVRYGLCILIALIVFTVVTVMSGSRGVLITDTLMAFFFVGAMVAAAIVIAKKTGGWTGTIASMAADPRFSDMLSWGGHAGALYDSGVSNVLWGVLYGVVWMSVCMAGPWQTSRYLMAKNEHVVVRSAVPAILGIFILLLMMGSAATFINIANPGLEQPSEVLIWASMNMLPRVLGVLLLTGVLAAGISSATTFLSLIGSTVANDLAGERSRDPIRTGRISMIVVSAVVLLIAVTNSPAIFWVMYFGGSIVAASWMPVVVASVAFPRLTKAGAFWGMLIGFLCCFFLRLYTGLTGMVLPVWLDPSIVGMVCNVIAMIIGSACTRVTPEEKESREALFVMPEQEKDPGEIRKTMNWMKAAVWAGVLITVLLLLLWVVPYLRS